MERLHAPQILATLESLLAIPAGDMRLTLSRACDLVATALRADKIDAFVYQPAKETLVALGTSEQPLSRLQKQVGLDILPIVNGGRAAQVFLSGNTYVSGRVDQDPEELRAVKEVLGVRSALAMPLEVGGERRGVLMATSQQPDVFGNEDVRFGETLARWVGLVAHRAELIQHIAESAAIEGRRAAAEELITVLAHDLRNHLGPIQLRVGAIQRRAEREKRDLDVRDSELALTAVSRLGDLVTDLLDVARLEKGVFDLDLRPVDVVELVEEAAGPLSTPEHPIVSRTNGEALVAADRARLRQCLENLLANATRHSPPRVPVTVTTARVKETNGEHVRIDVIDEGPGVPAEVLPRIFDRFVTGHRGGGLGLGLYLARTIATAHGGNLSVESSPGKGARFILTLPAFPDG